MSKKTLIIAGLLVLFATSILVLPVPQPNDLGTGDFRPYWSASYLLANHLDFSSVSNMDFVERTYTNWTKPFTMLAWFAPTGNLLMLPYTFFPFYKAAFLWLITNILVMSSTIFLLWNNTKLHLWIPFLVVFGFSMTLISLYVGQVNTIVLLGMAIYASLFSIKKDYLIGASLILTTIKPHLLILTLPLVIFDCIRRKRWRILIGFFITLCIFALVLFVIYPIWLISFWNLIRSGMDSLRNAPTISGVLLVVFGKIWGKWIWIPAICLAVFFWWFRGAKWNNRTMIDLSIITGLIISPIGWSYDQVILLIPIISILRWMVIGSIPKIYTIAISLTLIVSNGISFVMRIQGIDEVYYFWIPLIVLIIYIIGLRKSNNSELYKINSINGDRSDYLKIANTEAARIIDA